jgi:hypothetical protein
MRKTCFAGVVAAAVALLSGSLAAQKPAPAPAASIAGGWTRNADLSDAPGGTGSGQQGDDSGRTSGGGGTGNGGGYGGGGGRRRGGGGGGYGRGGGQRGGTPPANPDDVARMRDAMHDITNPSDHLVITQTDSMIVLTGADGRTTRLAPDGKKVKDENTKIERKTKWDGGKLVSEINGLGSGKMTQSFSIDPEGKQLRIVVVMEGRGQPRTITQVYDVDAK